MVLVMTLRAIAGGTVTFSARRSTVRHLYRDCSQLRRATDVVERREVDLWPGFVCERCRTRHGGRWPYS